MKEQRKIFHTNGNQRSAGVAKHTSYKTDSETKTVIRDKKKKRKALIMIRVSIQQKLVFINNYAPKKEAPEI